ncbi:MAG: hypothetical protein K9W45_08675 [Candidatus Heimdallarchaeum aukensis]|uniref:DOD-type homing endonuclease domain-containing protein n=1 Tax=Candidatus Heimdallarchaeum aukensis TaxID=2876573 RepID=A0A9Y1BIW8_9ARCH|nr:MAG: hypothetical protein K9W45_08675 [Candidatus Heimdallarchaeum aukensis]
MFLSPDLSYLVGALRDGSVYYYSRNRSYYTLFYQKYRSWLVHSIGKRITRLFGLNYSIDEYKRGHYRLRISSKRLYSLWIDQFGFPREGETQLHWDVPRLILDSDLLTQSYFLRAFFDTEGDVSPSSSSTYYLGLSQKNTTVLYQLKSLLSSFDIKTSSIHLADKKSNTYRFSIVGKEEIFKFRDKIGSEHPVKKEKIDQILLSSD